MVDSFTLKLFGQFPILEFRSLALALQQRLKNADALGELVALFFEGRDLRLLTEIRGFDPSDPVFQMRFLLTEFAPVALLLAFDCRHQSEFFGRHGGQFRLQLLSFF